MPPTVHTVTKTLFIGDAARKKKNSIIKNNEDDSQNSRKGINAKIYTPSITIPPRIRFQSEESEQNHCRILMPTDLVSSPMLCPVWLRIKRINEHNNRQVPRNSGSKAGETTQETFASS